MQRLSSFRESTASLIAPTRTLLAEMHERQKCIIRHLVDILGRMGGSVVCNATCSDIVCGLILRASLKRTNMRFSFRLTVSSLLPCTNVFVAFMSKQTSHWSKIMQLTLAAVIFQCTVQISDRRQRNRHSSHRQHSNMSDGLASCRTRLGRS
jgi:hypothetical protein